MEETKWGAIRMLILISGTAAQGTHIQYMFIIQYSLRAANTVIRHFSTSFPLIRQRMYRGRILGRNPDKRPKSIPPCYSQSQHTALP